MKISDLQHFNTIYIQCHDNPDADTIASGFALYRYWQAMGKTIRLFYGGNYRIQKANMKLMVKRLNIPIEHVTQLTIPEDALLVCVDCQYGGGNVTHFEAKNTAVIDHHHYPHEVPENWEIRSDYGSCSTLVWEMICEDERRRTIFSKIGSSQLEMIIFFRNDLQVSTALYYGLYMDTAQLGEVYHAADIKMRHELVVDRRIFNELIHSNITREELATIAKALQNDVYLPEYECSIVRVPECDPNILGLIADFILQADEIALCVVFSEMEDGYKFSVRSENAEPPAGALAELICRGIGSSGGQLEKAGGYLIKSLFNGLFPDMKPEDYLMDCVQQIHADNFS